jgi:hypothetical protein
MKKIGGSIDNVAIGYIVSMLEQADIEFVIRNQYLSGALGELPVMECWPEIWIVNDTDYEEAMEIARVATATLTDQDGSWQCRCGESNEGQFASCWKCGEDK